MTIYISCSLSIEDLLEELIKKTKKPSAEIESALFDAHLWPEGKPVYISRQNKPVDDWLMENIYTIMDEHNIKSLYIIEEL
jgi:hypothetical protein